MAEPVPGDGIREAVRERYAAAARRVDEGNGCCESVEPGSADETACCEPAHAGQARAGRATDAGHVANPRGAADAANAGVVADPDGGACCGSGEDPCGCGPVLDRDQGAVFGASQYAGEERDALPGATALASLGCGNPTAVAELDAGETVLDLGSGGGIDVLLSARRVGPSGIAYGLDMTDEMLDLARRNQREAGIENAEFLKGTIEEIPLADRSVDVVISNCVINLSADKPRVLREAARVLRPGGRLAVTDVVADPAMDAATRRDMESWTGCIAGALTEEDFRRELERAGFERIEIEETHRVHEHAGSAIVRARVPD